MIVLIFILVAIAGSSKGVMDIIAHHFYDSKLVKLDHHFWNENLYGYRNKYKNGNKSEGPKFFGSTTFLVAFTSAWHLFQLVMLTSLFAAMVLYSPIFNYHEFVVIRIIIDFILLRGTFGLFFVLFYNYILIKK